MIHNAVLQACDASDGVKDGVIENPRACHFDYATLACKGADGPSCLTAAAGRVGQGADVAVQGTGQRQGAARARTCGPAAELQWGTLGGPEPLANSLARVRNFHLKDPAWEFRLANIAADVERAARMDNGLLASNNFDLKPFFDRGGKLLMWHGWSDPQVPAENSIIYLRERA